MLFTSDRFHQLCLHLYMLGKRDLNYYRAIIPHLYLITVLTLFIEYNIIVYICSSYCEQKILYVESISFYCNINFMLYLALSLVNPLFCQCITYAIIMAKRRNT